MFVHNESRETEQSSAGVSSYMNCAARCNYIGCPKFYQIQALFFIRLGKFPQFREDLVTLLVVHDNYCYTIENDVSGTVSTLNSITLLFYFLLCSL